ncbi:IclR family transcriptional regulator [Ramlibacter sp. AW1]|uniref:IclR family transcriptional regulator n=1 Tax=Ramlibacter aurantiacus TaxID=2801330 RepID=A0A937D5P3_9BURK|nr:IclR family transcriptional regulator [Ramlibacter aurantiacus]MBL0421522.1 IclR family transcriptional regulator [Ramlibacter aurantiacus]
MDPKTSSADESLLGNSTADRVIEILLLFTDRQPRWTAHELSAQMGMPRSTIYRYLNSLKNSRMIVERGDGTFVLGPRIQVLAAVAKGTNNIVSVARDEMLKLAEAFNENLLLNEIADFEVATLERIESRHRVGLTSARGGLLPWPATASSKLFLAYAPKEKLARFWTIGKPTAYTDKTIVQKHRLEAELRQIRQQGFAYSDEERDEGVVGVAVPLMSEGACRYSLAFVAPKFRANQDVLAAMKQALLDAARSLQVHLA